MGPFMSQSIKIRILRWRPYRTLMGFRRWLYRPILNTIIHLIPCLYDTLAFLDRKALCGINMSPRLLPLLKLLLMCSPKILIFFGKKNTTIHSHFTSFDKLAQSGFGRR